MKDERWIRAVLSHSYMAAFGDALVYPRWFHDMGVLVERLLVFGEVGMSSDDVRVGRDLIYGAVFQQRNEYTSVGKDEVL